MSMHVETPVMPEAAAGKTNPPVPCPAAPEHVLFVIDQLCETGGAERCLLNMIRLLPKDRFRCSLLTFKIDRSGIFGDLPCPVHVWPLGRTYDWNALQVARKLRDFLRSEGVRIVHTFFETSDIWGGMVAKLSGDVRLVSSRRDMGILRSKKHQVAYRLLKPMFDVVLTVSEQVRSYCLEQDGLHPSKVTTLYNGIELSRIAAARPVDRSSPSFGLADASHLVATVGHIRRVKGMDVFIRAAAEVCRQLPRARFVVIGDAAEQDYMQELQQLTKSLDLTGNVRFLGPSESVFSILKSCDVFCLPSRSEGFSNALVEAMACGLPCVATRVGGNAEALDGGRCGFLVDSEHASAMAEKILLLLRQPELARRMGQEAKAVAEEKFSAQAMINGLVAVYDRLLYPAGN